MAQITYGTETYFISTLDGTDLYLTATTDGQPATLSAYDASNNPNQIWNLNINSLLATSTLVLQPDQNTNPLINVWSLASVYGFNIEGDDNSGYTIELILNEPQYQPETFGFLVPNGSNGVYISQTSQKWKFTKSKSKSGGGR